MIYWTPQHGAHAVTGGILAKWALQNFERSGYGYPIGDATTNEQEELTQDFEGGTIFADPNFFWQPFSCIDAISRIALENSVVDDFDFICSNRGISLTTSDTNFFGMPTVNDVVATTSFPSSVQQIEPQRISELNAIFASPRASVAPSEVELTR